MLISHINKIKNCVQTGCNSWTPPVQWNTNNQHSDIESQQKSIHIQYQRLVPSVLSHFFRHIFYINFKQFYIDFKIQDGRQKKKNIYSLCMG